MVDPLDTVVGASHVVVGLRHIAVAWVHLHPALHIPAPAVVSPHEVLGMACHVDGEPPSCVTPAYSFAEGPFLELVEGGMAWEGAWAYLAWVDPYPSCVVGP